ncbi:hypothetical protein [Nocardioides sp. B-3]|uniref:hypothetical protein n=1 Tax=Nocardioides sp. B-3 TaxID=2895565 RepID=UPI002152E826|nr:hypothetical protein [Nocardioides sp. B-3]UUZ61473.1 hypothetical protein LP418_13420 [Nocardioides sp. B-3]
MPHAPLARLAERIDAPVERLDPFAAFPAEDIERLDAIVARAFDTEDAAFTEALTGALRIVPRPLRGVARSLLFPGGAQ